MHDRILHTQITGCIYRCDVLTCGDGGMRYRFFTLHFSIITKANLLINRILTICMIHSSTQHYKKTSQYQHGLTLLELTIVLLILMALAGLTLPSFTEVPRYAQCTATKSTMKAIRDALLGNIDGPGYVADIGYFPTSLTALFTLPSYCSDRSITTAAACATASETWQPEDEFNPVTGKGWRGPYMQDVITIKATDLADGNFEDPTTVALSHISPPIAPGDAVILDSFAHGSVRRPIILQNPGDDATPDGNDCSIDVTGGTDPNECYRLVSAGANGVIDTKLADATGSDNTVTPPNSRTRGDDLILYLKIPDPTAITTDPDDTTFFNRDQTGCVLFRR